MKAILVANSGWTLRQERGSLITEILFEHYGPSRLPARGLPWLAASQWSEHEVGSQDTGGGPAFAPPSVGALGESSEFT